MGLVYKTFKFGFNVLLYLYFAASSVIQQAAAVRTHSDLQVGEYTDSDETLAWTGQQWNQEIIENQVCLPF